MSDCESIFFRKSNHVDAAVIFLNSCESISDDIQSQIQSYFEINEINLSIVANFDRLISLAKANSQLQDNSPIDKYFAQLNELLSRSNVDVSAWNFLSDSITLINQESATKNNPIKNSLFSSLQTQLYNFANTTSVTPIIDQSVTTLPEKPFTPTQTDSGEAKDIVDKDHPWEHIETIVHENQPATEFKIQELADSSPVAPLVIPEDNQNSEPAPPNEEPVQPPPSEAPEAPEPPVPIEDESKNNKDQPKIEEEKAAPIQEESIIPASVEKQVESGEGEIKSEEKPEKVEKGSTSKPALSKQKDDKSSPPVSVAKRNRNEPVVIIQHEIPRKTQLLLWSLEFVVACLLLYIALRTC